MGGELGGRGSCPSKRKRAAGASASRRRRAVCRRTAGLWLMSSTTRDGIGIHATAVIYRESGVLILGASGSGKSALALAVLALARMSDRFGALIGDDRVWVRAMGGRLIASGARHMAGLIERRSAGMESAPSELAAVIRLFVELSGPNRTWPRWPAERDISALEGIEVPRIGLNSAASVVDNAISVVDRLERRSHGGRRGGISLEQSAAVHKNRQLASSRTV